MNSMCTQLLAAAFVILVAMGCSSNHDKPAFKYEVKKVAEDIQIPKPVFDSLVKEIATEFKNISPVYVFFPLTVEFNDHNQSVFKQPHFRVQLEKGGGEIDLNEYITGRGSYYMHFPEEQFNTEWQLMHMYYISQAPVKKIENDKYGLGCGRWIDLKEQFGQFKKQDFLKLNTTDQRHLHVTAGHYVFVFRNKNQVLLSQLTVTDSKYTDKLCKTVKVAQL